jgi:aspartyl aminopeptidase
MNKELKNFLQYGYTPFAVCDIGEKFLSAHGFEKVSAYALPELKKGGKYFLSDGGTLVAFAVNKPDGFTIAAAHTDSPTLKIKGEKTLGTSPARLNCEVYGGAIDYTFFDRPLKICGRLYFDEGGKITARDVVSPYFVTVPSLAIHLQRDVNGSFAPSVQNDLSPILGETSSYLTSLGGDKAIDFDLYACPASEPYESGENGEYVCSPRIDNLTSVYSSLVALTRAKPAGISVAVCFNSEEVGSRTRTAAASAFFPRLLEKIFRAANGKDYDACLNNSFMFSADNAHAAHPAHLEKSDPINQVKLGGGIVIKRHTNYATDALTAAVAKKIFAAADVPVQEFYSHSDQPCGSTIGLISAANTLIRTCDIGIGQLAMHSASETCRADDIDTMTKGLTAALQTAIRFEGDGAEIK